MYKNVANFHRLLRTSTVQSTERVKIFPQKFFALKVGLGREELQGIVFHYKDRNIVFVICALDCDFWERILSLNSHVSLFYLLFYSLFYIHVVVVVVVHQENCWEEVELHRQRPRSQMS